MQERCLRHVITPWKQRIRLVSYFTQSLCTLTGITILHVNVMYMLCLFAESNVHY